MAGKIVGRIYNRMPWHGCWSCLVKAEERLNETELSHDLVFLLAPLIGVGQRKDLAMTFNIFEGARRIVKLVAVVWVIGVSSFTLTQGDPYITGTYYISASDRKLGSSHPSCENLSHFRQEELTASTKNGTEAHVRLCFPPEMKKSLVTIPSGLKFEVTAPVVATEQEVMAYVNEVHEFENRHRQEIKATKEQSFSRDVLEKFRYLDKVESALAKAKAVGDVAAVSALEGEVAKVKAGLPTGKPKRSDVPHGFREYDLYRDGPMDWDGQAFADHVKNTLVLSQADEEWIYGQWWGIWWERVREGVLVLVVGIVFLWALSWTTGWIVRGFLGIPRGQDQKAL